MIAASLPLDGHRARLQAPRTARFGGRIAAALRDLAHGRALAAAGVRPILNPFAAAADIDADHAARRP